MVLGLEGLLLLFYNENNILVQFSKNAIFLTNQTTSNKQAKYKNAFMKFKQSERQF
jgi:hypothetical protein